MGYALKIPRVNFSTVAIEQVEFIDEVPCTGISLSPNALTFEQAEETKVLTATLTPSNTTDVLVWTSSDTNVATVLDGTVTIHGIGSATITATCGNASSSISINQSTLKAAGTPKMVDGKQIEASGTDPNRYLRLASGTNQHSLGSKFTGESELAVGNGSTNDYELIKVPYGATVVKVATSEGASMVLNYIFRASTTTLVTSAYGELPAFISSDSFVGSDTGATVEYGQAIGFRIDDARLTATPSYVYFE